LLSLDQIVTIRIGPLRAFVGHARVMPDPRQMYKYDFLDLTRSPAKGRRTDIPSSRMERFSLCRTSSGARDSDLITTGSISR
jgi:hypothetical protein